MAEEKGNSAARSYVLAGGGTGGHVYPALAIAESIRTREPAARFWYVGVRKGAEAEIVPRRSELVPLENLRFLTAAGMPDRPASLAMFRFLAALVIGTMQAALLLRRIRPTGVIATGGYASAPTLLAARLLGIPILVNEQNAEPGKVNRHFGHLADVVTVAFEATLRYFPRRGVHVGYPVRAAIRTAASGVRPREERLRELKIDPARRMILITGGSLGARSINRAMAQVVARVAADPDVRARIFVVHGVGRNETADYHAWDDTMARLRERGVPPDSIADFYRPVRYLFDIERYYAAADVIVGRGGAGSIAEAAAFGKPFLIVPKSGLPGDHQVKNALAMAEAGACRVLLETWDPATRQFVLDPPRLFDEIRALAFLSASEREALGRRLASLDHPDCLTEILRAMERAFRGRA